GALRRDRGCNDRASRDRLGCRAIEGRLVRALGAHGEMERMLAHRGSARPPRPFRRRGAAEVKFTSEAVRREGSKTSPSREAPITCPNYRATEIKTSIGFVIHRCRSYPGGDLDHSSGESKS